VCFYFFLLMAHLVYSMLVERTCFGVAPCLVGFDINISQERSYRKNGMSNTLCFMFDVISTLHAICVVVSTVGPFANQKFDASHVHVRITSLMAVRVLIHEYQIQYRADHGPILTCPAFIFLLLSFIRCGGLSRGSAAG